MALPENGGYDCEFVEKPNSVFQTDCPICLMKLHDPYIVSCCGKSYCEDCIKCVQLQGNQCPSCTSKFDIFPNKGLKQSLNQLHVYCTYRADGCKWKGELGQLDQHLNKNFAPDEEGVGCLFARIKCIHCNKEFQRQEHCFASCSKRIVVCKYCNLAYVLGDLKQQLNLNPSVENWLEHHISKECSLTVVECDYHSAGCNIQLPRKDMPAHLAKYVGTHLGLLKAQNSSLSEQILENNAHIKQLKVLLLLFVLLYCNFPVVLTLAIMGFFFYYEWESNVDTTSLVPYAVTLCNFKKLRRDRTVWHSSPFYTHRQGYRMCLRVAADGYRDGKGTHVSVFVCLMRGEFDDHLKWPFRGDITIQLQDQERKEGHQTKVISFTDTTPDNSAGRQVTVGERNQGWGVSRFISHSQLSSKYLKKDCLQFRVLKVELKN